MSTSTIVVIVTIVIGLSTIPLITRGLHILFKDYMKLEDHRKEKHTTAKVEVAKDKLKETTDNGSLADLIEAAKELGEKKL